MIASLSQAAAVHAWPAVKDDGVDGTRAQPETCTNVAPQSGPVSLIPPLRARSSAPCAVCRCPEWRMETWRESRRPQDPSSFSDSLYCTSAIPSSISPPPSYRRTTICECQLSCTLRRDSNSYVFILKRHREGGRSPALPPSLRSSSFRRRRSLLVPSTTLLRPRVCPDSSAGGRAGAGRRGGGPHHLSPTVRARVPIALGSPAGPTS